MRSTYTRRISQLSLDGFLSRCLCQPLCCPARCRAFRGSRHPTPPIRSFTATYRRKSAKLAETPGNPQSNRIAETEEASSIAYPRLAVDRRALSCGEFRSKYDTLAKNETIEQDTVVIYGRIRSQRTAGSKLIFFDVIQNGHKVQALCNQRILLEQAGVTPEKFREFYHSLRRGDVCSIVGKPHRTGRGELSVLVTDLPQLMSKCFHDVPLDAKDQVISPYDRHVQFLTNPSAADILRARSRIVQCMRDFFLERDFMEVNTPVLASAAGGAIAQPFLTSAEEFPERPLALRIAPEIWLKRLVVGGFDRVFEIGPQFRNEGLDRTHNPEFTTCEFYQAYADLETLMGMTEALFTELSKSTKALNEKVNMLQPPDVDFSCPFPRIDFVPSLEEAMGEKLPDLKAEDASTKVAGLFERLSIPLPQRPTLPRLLDKLCSEYLEPKCKAPMFIINHPECMSPLAKSYQHPTCGQVVSARAELFIEEQEMVNMYEEENSPFEQRRKFQEQLRHRDPETPGEVDESYVQALEWGLPPTGGWGCGIDRLCMLFTGARRIGDVLSFGNLRAVTKPLPRDRQLPLRIRGVREDIAANDNKRRRKAKLQGIDGGEILADGGRDGQSLDGRGGCRREKGSSRWARRQNTAVMANMSFFSRNTGRGILPPVIGELERSTGDPQQLAFKRDQRYNDPPPPNPASGETTRPPSPGPPPATSERDRMDQRRRARNKSRPKLQFNSQSDRERRRLAEQGPRVVRGRKQTLHFDLTMDFKANANNNVRQRWVEQGIWMDDWGPPWPIDSKPMTLSWKRPDQFPDPGARWGHEEEFEPEPERVPEPKQEQQPDVFDISPFAPASSIMRAREPVTTQEPPMRPRCPNREASRPYYQFLYQVSKETEWIKDELEYKRPAQTVDIDAMAYESVKKNWIEDGIWSPKWGKLPGMTWIHEEPDEEERAAEADDESAGRLPPRINENTNGSNLESTQRRRQESSIIQASAEPQGGTKRNRGGDEDEDDASAKDTRTPKRPRRDAPKRLQGTTSDGLAHPTGRGEQQQDTPTSAERTVTDAREKSGTVRQLPDAPQAPRRSARIAEREERARLARADQEETLQRGKNGRTSRPSSSRNARAGNSAARSKTAGTMQAKNTRRPSTKKASQAPSVPARRGSAAVTKDPKGRLSNPKR